MVAFDLTDEDAAIRDEVRKFAQEELRARDRECEEARAIPDDLRAAYATLGLAAFDWPEELGGAGLTAITRTIVEEELAAGCAGMATGLCGPGPAAWAMLELCTDGQRRALAPRLADAMTCTAISERDLGAEIGSMDTRAERTAGGFRLAGRKCFCVNADKAWLFVVFARTDEAPRMQGVRAFAVERDAKGLTIGREDDRIGLRAVRSCEVMLDGVIVPESALLGEWETPYTPAATDRFFARTWLQIAARQVGVGRAAVEYAIYYAQDRTAFGRKIGSFQGVAFKIADAATDVDSARLLVQRAAFHLDRGRDVLAEAALAAVHANEAAVRATIDAVQVLGGAGFMEDYPVEKWMRDARALAQLYGHDPLRNHLAGERRYGPLGEGEGSVDPAAAFAAFGQAFG